MLHVNDLTYRIGKRLLFDKATVALPDGAKVGFVARNGAGKTTLFRIIAGELATEEGSTSIPRNLRVGRVAQEVPSGPERLIDVVLAADTERTGLLAQREHETDPHHIAEIEMRLADIGAHAAEARAGAILHGLGFDAEAQRRPCSDFSGGWRMRVALAAVLFSQPDLLMLDEPTNYLDLEGTLWLYDYLERYPRTAIVISHDRELLDTAVDHILHLDQGKLILYRGNYTSFDKQRREKQMLQTKARDKQEAERKKLVAFVDRFRAKATKARQAQSRMKRLEKMEPIAAIVEQSVLPFHLPAPQRTMSPPLVVFEKVFAGYGDKIVLKNVNLTLSPDDRIALLGPNGNGKSTFAKLLSGRLDPLDGDIRRSKKMDVAFFAQHQLDELNPAGSPYTHVTELMPDAFESVRRSRCAQMGFPGAKADTTVANLSGGEKARLQLGLAAFNGPHLLVLDEPTNHLDIDSRAALVEAINEYPGAVILVSHDRFLIEATCERLWLVANQTIKNFDGDLDDYRKLILAGDLSGKNERDTGRDDKFGRVDQRRDAAEKRVALAPLRKKLEALEARIEKFTALIARIDEALAVPDSFAKQPGKAVEIAKQRAELTAALAATEEEWLSISSEIEAA
ncbi:MAG: ABC-F family ATP-binding cassette domain-containing protein [Beijerinckiaceae bacterium]